MQTKPTTSLIDPFSVQLELATGIMLNPHDHIVRRAADMQGYYADEAALQRLIAEQQNPVHYETFESAVPEEYGQVKFCISKLYPDGGTRVLHDQRPLSQRDRDGRSVSLSDGTRPDDDEDGRRCLSLGGVRARSTRVCSALLGASLDQYGRRTADLPLSVSRRRRAQLWGHSHGGVFEACVSSRETK